MERVHSIKMLAVLALVLLGSSVNEGRVLDKCQLKAQMEEAYGSDAAEKTIDGAPGVTVGDVVAKLMCSMKKTSGLDTGFTTSVQAPGSNSTMNLYGLFLLSDRVACNSGSNPSLNICRLDCSALTDDDLSDDIRCLKIVMKFVSILIEDAPHPPATGMHFLHMNECSTVVASDYFADCP
ncbi:lysozyme C-3-like [Misgurnus anguillicaudatus]|uniref:lysozyme C-3-like n=1 Tax=Misgurnus anguillicaudatus TaxID=75329 RepID=UPI003CCF1244